MRTTAFLLFGIICFSEVSAQKNKALPNLDNSLEVWKVLRTLKYEAKPNGVFQPFFSPVIQQLEGKNIVLEGFMVVVQHERKPKNFMLSYLPINSCFFCGAAGPETVVEVVTEKGISFTDDPIALRGTLRLNAKDENKMFYILENATALE
ncbi:MAG: hypothetical protein H7Y04_05775 [Verrucomicrobia bacterium]|nr:hypothetical protein [Cytophagales bacterium]